MIHVLKKADFIPPVPVQLIHDLSQIESRDNVFAYPSYRDHYASYVAQKNLEEWAQRYFDHRVITRYQVVRRDLPIHVDVGIVGRKFNYLTTLGGDNVKTRWWDSVDPPGNMIYEKTWTSEDLNVWWDMSIETAHQVLNLQEPRISITVRPSE